MHGGQETCSHAVSLCYSSQYTQLYMKTVSGEHGESHIFFSRWWSQNSDVVRSRSFSDVFLPLPPSLCAADSGSSVLRLSPRSPGPGLDVPCPPLTVPRCPATAAGRTRYLTALQRVLEVWLACVLAGQPRRLLLSHRAGNGNFY